jgi:hypothetical protein
MALTKNDINNVVHAAKIKTEFDTDWAVTHTLLVNGH